ncbi:MAG: Arc family DNA-binding protein [Xylophilus ampelinus]
MRLPEELKNWLKHQAVDNRRSLNNELLHRLEQSRSQQQAAGQ